MTTEHALVNANRNCPTFNQYSYCIYEGYPESKFRWAIKKKQ